jgi:drug/metabolite transporter (DMT)-like permease
VDVNAQPTAARSNVFMGVVCGTGAALGWAAGFVVAKYGISVGFSPADLAFHRFFWFGLIMLPIALRGGVRDFGGIGWGRGLVMSVFAGPPQAMIAYSGFILVPLGHGTTIQPAVATLSGLIMASLALHERATTGRWVGGALIIAGLTVFGAESLATIGNHGVGGDLLFATAGFFWASFGILLRYWQVSGLRALAAVGVLSILLYAPIFVIFVGFENLLRMGLANNALQMVAQGLLAGALPIYLFTRAVILLGAGRAATFPALVPVFALIIGYLGFDVVPSLAQVAGLLIVVVGFRFVVR